MEIRQHPKFQKFFAEIKDEVAKRKILVRIKNLAAGNPGDVEPAGDGVSEMRIMYGPGYRVYYVQSGKQIVILLTGGTKKRQQQDIETAKQLAREIRR